MTIQERIENHIMEFGKISTEDVRKMKIPVGNLTATISKLRHKKGYNFVSYSKQVKRPFQKSIINRTYILQ